ncbi:MAG TPA: MmcQ/YjbR family DNA-binding protein, partial [Polyangiaceae bacterium]|nr:MmcQ/YjbR family DNA-binding protein [Polyangiaceae bacterium]
GLGKAGWVTASFPRGRDVPLPLVKEWLDESYRAIAPAKWRTSRPGAGSTRRTESAGATQNPKPRAARARPTDPSRPRPAKAKAKAKGRRVSSR